MQKSRDTHMDASPNEVAVVLVFFEISHDEGPAVELLVQFLILVEQTEILYSH